jgi:hypothetical protein
MTTEELKKEIADFLAEREGRKGVPAFANADGPVGMKWIKSLLAIIEAQEKRIKSLENNAGKTV